MQEEPSAKSLDFAQKYKDAFNAFVKVGFSRDEAIKILGEEAWYHHLFEDHDLF